MTHAVQNPDLALETRQRKSDLDQGTTVHDLAQKYRAGRAGLRSNELAKGGNRADRLLRRFSWEEGQ